MSNYVVEHNENGVWTSKLRTNFADPNFYKVAKCLAYRILCDGVDVTAQFREGSPDEPAVTVTKKSLMKPSEYKALSMDEKIEMQRIAAELKDAKKKRTEIMAEMGISEATYDTIRADMASMSNSEPNPPAVSDNKPEKVATLESTQPPKPAAKPRPFIHKGGLLGRR